MENAIQLPKSCIPCPKIEDDCYDWYKRHDSRLALVAKASYDLVFIGDSITHFWEGEGTVANYGTAVWKDYYGKRKVLNIGYGFDRTQNVLWRLAHGELDGQHPKAIVLNIGTNQFSATENYPCDTPEDAAAGIVAVVRTLRKMLPDTQIIVMALFPRGERHANFRSLIPKTNELVRNELKDCPKITLMDIGNQMLEPNGDQKKGYFLDGTHLTETGYRVWAEALEPLLKQFLNE